MKGKVSKEKSSSKSPGAEEIAPIGTIVSEETSQILCKIVSDSLKQSHELIVSEMCRRVAGNVQPSASTQNQQTPSAANSEWQPIESLSRLRGIVGGRFQNIKSKWLETGFPLREHRGDKVKDFTIDEKGWLNLSNWMLKQGYESRLAIDEASHLFEIRKI